MNDAVLLGLEECHGLGFAIVENLKFFAAETGEGAALAIPCEDVDFYQAGAGTNHATIQVPGGAPTAGQGAE